MRIFIAEKIYFARFSITYLDFDNVDIAHYSKCVKDINAKFGILAHHDKVQLQDKRHNSERYVFGAMTLVN